MELCFSQYFNVSREALDKHGAIDISAASDLPLFIDPFLLFHSDKAEYPSLREGGPPGSPSGGRSQTTHCCVSSRTPCQVRRSRGCRCQLAP